MSAGTSLAPPKRKARLRGLFANWRRPRDSPTSCRPRFGLQAEPFESSARHAQACRWLRQKEKPACAGFSLTGGDRGIRTLDTGLSPYASLAGKCLRPLGQVSTCSHHDRSLGTAKAESYLFAWVPVNPDPRFMHKTEQSGAFARLICPLAWAFSRPLAAGRHRRDHLAGSTPADRPR